MGTSKSSTGSPSGVPLVPPWVPKDASDTLPEEKDKKTQKITAPRESEKPGPMNPNLDTTSPTSPEGRFRSPRTQLGKYARYGESSDLKRGIGSYTKSGLGGKKQATRRLTGSAVTVGTLYGLLNSLSSPGNTTDSLDKRILSGKTAEEIIGAIVDATRPLDGTQDAESCRASINDSLVELLEIQQDADLLNLTDIQKELVIERFIASEIFRRFILDVGSAIRNKAQNATIAANRLKEAKEYIREVVAFSLRKLKQSGITIGQSNIRTVSKNLLNESFSIFEEYI